MSEFYRSFEERYRGSRELIKSRLETFLPFARPFLDKYPSPEIVDLGCGRGEWLEVMGDEGFVCKGYDIDEWMLKACYERNLPAELGDAVTALRALPDESQVIVSGFHLVEHMPVEQLHVTMAEAHRVLVPDGLLILETPNPENIQVAACTFYLDPTHNKPIPPDLLEFFAAYYEYERRKILRLQESIYDRGNKMMPVYEVVSGVSPDYALVAQKAVPENDHLESEFLREYGRSLQKVCEEYDAAVMRRIRQLEQKVESQANTVDSLWRVSAPLRAARYVVQRFWNVWLGAYTWYRNAQRKLGFKLIEQYHGDDKAQIRPTTSTLGRLMDIAVRKGRWWSRLVLRALIGQLTHFPGVRAPISRALDICPTLKTRLQALMASPRDPYQPWIGGFMRVPKDESSLTRSGREAYRILVDSMEKRDR